MRVFATQLFILSLLACLLTGCRSRSDFYQAADRDAYCLLDQKTIGRPWSIPPGFSIESAPGSRWANHGSLVCPQLPCQPTALYAYSLPLMRSEYLDESEDDEQTLTETENPVGAAIPPKSWRAIPSACLQRMFDFESIRREARYTGEKFEVESLFESQSSQIPRLTLEDVIDLALLNSRDYQTQKEELYLSALALARERFAYITKFSAANNGTGLNYLHERSDGITEDRLSIPTTIQIDRALITGGDLLARFANDILLTFNGDQGFTARVSSSLLLELVQPLLQKDIQFESLTRAERNVVYAARDFARFRKLFFVDFAGDYYDVILSFRQIEIASQNYFSLVRAFNQAEAEYRAGLVPRFQVDQVEQNLLGGRQSLINACNAVEVDLDQLKLNLGIPTETPINIDLTELNELTRLDQLSVSADSTNRVLERLRDALETPNRIELASTAAVLLDRLIEAAELNINPDDQQRLEEYRQLRARFLVDYSRLYSEQILADLIREVESESPSEPVIFQRSLAHSSSLIILIERQLDFAALQGLQETDEWTQFDGMRQASLDEISQLRQRLQAMIGQTNLEGLARLIEESNEVRRSLQNVVAQIDAFASIELEVDAEADLQRITSAANSLVRQVGETLSNPGFGLKPIDIDVDDAMITALVLRYDLMNQRGQLADDWRQIKLAADNLKSIIDLRARHQIFTDSNQPFDFDFDDSTTSLGLTVDAPLNRFTERNLFRRSLIDYQRSLRSLSLLEDTIKFSVRNDLRNLALDREQYLISVASAALAYERVVSTSLEFRLGTGGVTARDFLEAQEAYIRALSDVAERHIQYITDRTQLFFDLELLMVDEDGFWSDLRNEEVQPETYFDFPSWADPIYGELPCVRYSEEIRQMLCPSICAERFGPEAGTNAAIETDAMATESLDRDEINSEPTSLTPGSTDQDSVGQPPTESTDPQRPDFEPGPTPPETQPTGSSPLDRTGIHDLEFGGLISTSDAIR